MRHALKLSWLAPLFAIACGGSTAADLFNDAPRGGAAGAGANGGASAQGGTTTSNGGNASGGASAQGGSSAASGGASAQGGTASGGSSATAGSDVGGSTAGGSGTAGASTQGGSSAGGTAAGGASTGGAASGGTSGQAGGTTGAGGMMSGAQCEQMRTMLTTLLTEAQRCSLAVNSMQCTGFVDSECGCQVPVNNPDSAATKAYTTAVASYKSSCTFACPAIACVKPTTARCSTSGSGSQGRCVASTIPLP